MNFFTIKAASLAVTKKAARRDFTVALPCAAAKSEAHTPLYAPLSGEYSSPLRQNAGSTGVILTPPSGSFVVHVLPCIHRHDPVFSGVAATTTHVNDSISTMSINTSKSIGGSHVAHEDTSLLTTRIPLPLHPGYTF
ncbi:MAG: hypothetical protein ACJ8KO_02350 [Sulfurifustaceae bacterium]